MNYLSYNNRVEGGKCPLFLESLFLGKFSAINLSKNIEVEKRGQVQGS